MKHTPICQLTVIFLLIALAAISCRKKDERYEGAYVGNRQHTVLDSGVTTFSIDTN